MYRLSVALAILLASHAFAQVDTASPTVKAQSPVYIRPDTSQAPDTSGGAAFHPAKSPWLAVGMSAALPGLGQIYDHGYWKVPLIWGLGAYWIYEWKQLNSKYHDYRGLYAASLLTSPGGNTSYLNNRDFYRNERDKFAWFLGALYLLNMVDAYVGAHLYDFDVSPDLAADGRLYPRVTASVRFRF